MYERHPGNTEPEAFLHEPQAGGNCELITHAITYARGFALPRVRSSEIFSDTKHTKPITSIDETKTGDIIGLARVGKIGYRGIHMGVLWVPEDKHDIYVIHNAKHRGYAINHPLKEAMDYPEHATIAWIKRPIDASKDANPEGLTRLGVGFLYK